MLTVYPHNQLGQADFGWLQARHHFSFGRYYNPQRMQFGALRVVNDDRVAAGTGFPPHPHDNMEIITYVRSGSIRHTDNLGNKGVTPAGDVQVMSAGSGIAHAEFADDAEPTTLYQIWIVPHTQNVTPRWEQAEFPKEKVEGALRLLVSGHESDKASGALFIHQNARLWGGKLAAETKLAQAFGPRAYVLVSQGEVTVNGQPLKAGDGAEATDMETLDIMAQTEAEVLVIELPA